MRDMGSSLYRCWKAWKQRLRISYGTARILNSIVLALLAFIADVRQKESPRMSKLNDSKSLKAGRLARVVWLVLSTNTLSISKWSAIILNEATYPAFHRDSAISRRKMNAKAGFKV
jgi:hypothetical protein